MTLQRPYNLQNIGKYTVMRKVTILFLWMTVFRLSRGVCLLSACDLLYPIIHI